LRSGDPKSHRWSRLPSRTRFGFDVELECLDCGHQHRVQAGYVWSPGGTDPYPACDSVVLAQVMDT
jgi:hypothetical protein